MSGQNRQSKVCPFDLPRAFTTELLELRLCRLSLTVSTFDMVRLSPSSCCEYSLASLPI